MTAFANQNDRQAVAVEEIGRPLALDMGELAVFSSVRLDEQAEPRRGGGQAVLVIHGALRNAGDHYRAVTAASRGAGRPVVIAPQFLAEVDVRRHPAHSGLLHWATEDWKGGLGRVSSFAVMDQLLLRIANTFPGLDRVTVAGHSAGGQFVNRYAAVGRGPDLIAPYTRFVIANPSTYLYFDRLRPTPDGFAIDEDPEVDQWRYGFSGELPDYLDKSPAEYFAQYIERDVVYLLGEEDTDPDAALLEVHPAAMAHGRHRRERGELYHTYLQHRAHQKHRAERPVHRLAYVEGVGHDAAAMFTSPVGRACLFGPVI